MSEMFNFRRFLYTFRRHVANFRLSYMYRRDDDAPPLQRPGYQGCAWHSASLPTSPQLRSMAVNVYAAADVRCEPVLAQINVPITPGLRTLYSQKLLELVCEQPANAPCIDKVRNQENRPQHNGCGSCCREDGVDSYADQTDNCQRHEDQNKFHRRLLRFKPS